MHAAGPRRRGATALAGLAATAALVAGLVATAAPSNAAPPITPTGISVALATDNAGIGGVVPDVLAAAGDPIQLTMTLTPAGATFNQDTPLSVSTYVGSGTVSPSSVVFPKNTNSMSVPMTYSAVENGVQVDVAPAQAKGKPNGIPAHNVSAPFDSLKTLLKAAAGSPDLAGGFGAAQCGTTTDEPLCGIVMLPNGITADTTAALGIATCTSSYGCRPGSQIVSFIADLSSASGAPLYTRTSPATIILRCDKSVCNGGGISSYTVKASTAAIGGSFADVPACPAKGVVGANQTMCTDYVQSTRDNAGDLLLYWLITEDPRGTI
jgi:hypothetical protein